MKEKIHYAIEGALAVAVIILFIFHFSGNKNDFSNSNVVVREHGTVSDVMSVAYIDLDSLMENYTYSIVLSEYIAKEFENSRAKLTQQARKFQSDYEEFQRKIETGSFLSRERAETEGQRLAKRQKDLQDLEAQYAQELSEKQMRENSAMRQIIYTQINAFNKDKGYHFIFGKMGESILYANGVYNITAEVIDYLNRNYTPPAFLSDQ